DHHVGGELRPALRHLDVVLLEDRLAALVRDARGAQLPLHAVEGVHAGPREVALDHEPARLARAARHARPPGAVDRALAEGSRLLGPSGPARALRLCRLLHLAHVASLRLLPLVFDSRLHPAPAGLPRHPAPDAWHGVARDEVEPTAEPAPCDRLAKTDGEE